MMRVLFDELRKHTNSVKYWSKKGAQIGSGCDIHSTVSLGSEPYLVTIGDNVRLNKGVSIFTHDGGAWVIRNLYEEYKRVDILKRVNIGNNVHIGTNAYIMPGVNIGNNCIIGVGAIVTKDVPDNSIAVGVPARVIESIDEYVRKNSKHFIYTKSMSQEEKKDFLLKGDISIL